MYPQHIPSGRQCIPGYGAMNKDQIRKDLEHDEGKVNHAYQDSLGYWTIGIGHLIDSRRGGKLPDEIIYALLDYDIEQKARELDQNIPWWRDLDDVRQTVIIEMAFNLGIGGLMAFKNTLGMVQSGDYVGAAENMLKSKWARQVGQRANRLSERMRTGEI